MNHIMGENACCAVCGKNIEVALFAGPCPGANWYLLPYVDRGLSGDTNHVLAIQAESYDAARAQLSERFEIPMADDGRRDAIRDRLLASLSRTPSAAADIPADAQRWPL